MKPLLNVQNISMHFGGVKAVDDMTFKVTQGDFLGVIGPNGSGKTTLFNVITGIYTPTCGKIFFDGKDITGQPLKNMISHGIARTFQNLRTFRGMTVIQNVMMGDGVNNKTNLIDCLFHTRRWKKAEKQSYEKSMHILSLLGMADQSDQYVGSLPYGMQKRVELARAAVTSPKLLMLDEPTAGLNDKEAYELVHVIEILKEKEDLAIIMIEHNMKVMMSTAKEILAMDSGQQIAFGLPEEIQNNPMVISAYLGEDRS